MVREPRVAGHPAARLGELAHRDLGHQVAVDELRHPGRVDLAQLDAQIEGPRRHFDLEAPRALLDAGLSQGIDERAPLQRPRVPRRLRGRRLRRLRGWVGTSHGHGGRRQRSAVEASQGAGGRVAHAGTLVLLREGLESIDGVPAVPGRDPLAESEAAEIAGGRRPDVLVAVSQRSEKVAEVHALQLEVHGHGHDHRDRHAVEQGRGVLPLRHGLAGGIGERRHALPDDGIDHVALGADRALEDDLAAEAGAAGVLGVLGSNALESPGRLNPPADLPGRLGRVRHRGRAQEADQGHDHARCRQGTPPCDERSADASPLPG